jgi:hypothetical protein
MEEKKEEVCLFTGLGGSPMKKMCLNCVSCNYITDAECYGCNNEKVLEHGKEEILKNVPEGFSVKSIELEPMVLKNPTKKCPNYKADMELLVAKLKEIYEN